MGVEAFRRHTPANPRCDVAGCLASAVVALVIAGHPGHTHVCREHERIDREWVDVVESWPTPCEWCAENPEHPVYNTAPTVMGGA